MNNRLCCNRWRQAPATRRGTTKLRRWMVAAVFLATLAYAPAAVCDAPQWMHDLVNAPLPTHDEKTDAVLLYAETNVTVVSQDRVKTVVREAYKILRPEGREHGIVVVFLNSHKKITSL